MAASNSHDQAYFPYCLPTTEIEYPSSLEPQQETTNLPRSLELDFECCLGDTSVALASPGVATTLVNDLRRSAYFRPAQHISPAPSNVSSVYNYQVPYPTASESGNSAASSNMGSPAVRTPVPQYPQPWMESNPMIGIGSGAMYDDAFGSDAYSMPMSLEPSQSTERFRGVPFDPTAVHQPYPNHLNLGFPIDLGNPFSQQTLLAQAYPLEPYPPRSTSLPASYVSSQGLSRSGSNNFKTSQSQSSYAHGWRPYAVPELRQQIVSSSANSKVACVSPESESFDLDFEAREKSRCPFPACGKVFKDLKAHIITHQDERPEKCPVASCDYHKRGFARRYDRNRHTLTHYKGTMVCSWCPGSGSSVEKSFNRADVFKRHLMTCHGVEQTGPNGRAKKTPPALSTMISFFPSGESSGKCPTCGGMFRNPTELYEHLDDCVLLHVQQLDESEAVNERLLSVMDNDEAIQVTFTRSNISLTAPATANKDDDFSDEAVARLSHGGGGGSRSNRGRRLGVTFSKGEVPLASKSGRRRKKHYPQRWGCSAEDMRMKKRVLTVFEGQRRLVKDDMMLCNDYEVRIPLPGDGQSEWITDLDVRMVKRAEGFHGATADERGSWIPDSLLDPEIVRLMSS